MPRQSGFFIMPKMEAQALKEKLKGKNRIREFRRVAQSLASKIASHEGVIGIVFIGGLVRGFADKFSDVDITVFLKKKDKRLRRRIRSIGVEEQKRLGVDVDLEVHFLEDFKRERWSEAYRWEMSRAEIVFDPEREIKGILERKLKLPEDFWVKRVVVCAEYLKWYCCPPKEEVGTMAGAWVERGDLASAHYCLGYAVDLLLRLVYALNMEFVPAPKWRLFYADSLEWFPKGFRRHVEEAMTVKSLSAEDFGRRLEAVRKIWMEIPSRIRETTGLTLNEVSRYYVERVLRQGD